MLRPLIPTLALLSAPLLSAPLLSAPLLQAQAISVYGTFTVPHVSDVRNGGAAPNYDTTSFWAPGFGAGATFGIIPIGPIRLGFDVRGSSKPGTNGVDTGLAGVKLGVKLPFIAIKPYVQASGGYLGTRTKITAGAPTGGISRDHFVGYEFFAGADIPIAPFFDLRAVEIGGGHAYNISGLNDTSGNYSINVFTVSTGLVLHF
jgi:hypothetical protein